MADMVCEVPVDEVAVPQADAPEGHSAEWWERWKSAAAVLLPVADKAGYALAEAPAGFAFVATTDRSEEAPLSSLREPKFLAALSRLPQVARAVGVETEYREPDGAMFLAAEVAVTVRCPGSDESFTLRLTPTRRVALPPATNRRRR
jgi:hypothetical protein